MLMSVYNKLSLFNAHILITSLHIYTEVNQLCLNQVFMSLALSRPVNQPVRTCICANEVVLSLALSRSVSQPVRTCICANEEVLSFSLSFFCGLLDRVSNTEAGSNSLN